MTPSPSTDPAPSPFWVWWSSFWRRIIATSDPAGRRRLIATVWGLVAVIGIADYLTGFELSLVVFYLLPVCLAVAAIGWRFGSVVAVASVATWLCGDFAAGAHYSNPLVPYWNALIVLGTYGVVIWLLSSLLALHREMEERIRHRTAALTEEIAERERLEKVILDLSDRERRSIGRDLHDGLGQHLTGTALVAQAAATKLAARQAEETAEVKKVVGLIEQGIEQTRNLAKGLLLAEIESDGLVPALQELTAATSRQFRKPCEFHLEGEAAAAAGGAATHLYRIAQEAVHNAVRHSQAGRLDVTLTVRNGLLRLTVRDDGVGLPPPSVPGRGLGLRIMAHRAAIVGARFHIESSPRGGTLVACELHPPPSRP